MTLPTLVFLLLMSAGSFLFGQIVRYELDIRPSPQNYHVALAVAWYSSLYVVYIAMCFWLLSGLNRLG